VTPRRRSGTLKVLKWALALISSCQGHLVGCSWMGCCYHPGYGCHPPLATARRAPPPAALQTPPTVAQQTPTVAAQQAPPDGLGYHRVPTARW
jgi:hypothetical protein